MAECSHNCESCSSKCDERESESLKAKPHEGTKVGKVIAVVSGKGGVGKSLVTGLCAVASERLGYRTAVLDADVTGPSVPKMFGITDKAMGSELGLFPAVSRGGARVMSLNLLLDDETSPVVWRGPIISGAVKQFWTDVIWDDVDYMFIDMPPGTGDVPLTVFQSLPIDGIIIVTSPQELVSMIVEKAVNMAKMMKIPVLGLVENMSYFECPDCGKRIEIFGESKFEETAAKFGIEPLMRIPVLPALAQYADNGKIEDVAGVELSGLSRLLEKLGNKKKRK